MLRNFFVPTIRKKLAWLGPLAMLLLTALPAYSDCDKCEDLCKLMDQYLQREKGIELWRQYAASTPDSQKKAVPAGMGAQIQNQVWIEFTAWSLFRKQRGQLPCIPATDRADRSNEILAETFDPTSFVAVAAAADEPPEEDSLPSTDLETYTADDSCEIRYKGKKLEGDTLKQYEDDVGCKALSDATISHENVHQEHCMNAYHQDRANAPTLLRDPAFVAESELQAWSRQKEIIGEAIRKIIREKGCGWQPTKGQQKDINAVPSLKQTQAMENQAWQAVKALSTK